jgi:hypothetical protein
LAGTTPQDWVALVWPAALIDVMHTHPPLALDGSWMIVDRLDVVPCRDALPSFSAA